MRSLSSGLSQIEYLLPRGLKTAAGSIAHESPDMRNFTRTGDRVPRLEPDSFIADLCEVVALDDIEPLILVVMHVAWDAALLAIAMFHDEHLESLREGRFRHSTRRCPKQSLDNNPDQAAREASGLCSTGNKLHPPASHQ